MTRKSEHELRARLDYLAAELAKMRSDIKKLERRPIDFAVAAANRRAIADEDIFGPMRKGEYKAEIMSIEKRTSRHSKTDYRQVTFRVLEDPYEGRLLWSNYSSKVKWRFLQLCETLEVRVGEQTLDHYLGGYQGMQYSFNEQDLIGKLCTIEVVFSYYQGKTMNEVRGVKRFRA